MLASESCRGMVVAMTTTQKNDCIDSHDDDDDDDDNDDGEDDAEGQQ